MVNFNTDTPSEADEKKDLNRRKGSVGDHHKPTIVQEARDNKKQELALISPNQIVESRCHVCQHPNRDFIEVMIAQGVAYSSISERVSPEVDRRSLSNHAKKHMTLHDAIMRDVLEKEAERIGNLQNEAARDIISTRGVLEVMMRKGFEDLVNGVTTVEPKELLKITEILNAMDSRISDSAVEEATMHFAILQDAIKNVCEDDVLLAIVQETKRLRAEKGYSKEIEKGLDNTVDAEVIEDDEG